MKKLHFPGIPDDEAAARLAEAAPPTPDDILRRSEAKYQTKKEGLAPPPRVRSTGTRPLRAAAIAACAVLMAGVAAGMAVYLHRARPVSTPGAVVPAYDADPAWAFPKLDLASARLYYLVDQLGDGPAHMMDTPVFSTLTAEDQAALAEILTHPETWEDLAHPLDPDQGIMMGGRAMRIYLDCDGLRTEVRFYSDGKICQVYGRERWYIPAQDGLFEEVAAILDNAQPGRPMPFQTVEAAIEDWPELPHLLFDVTAPCDLADAEVRVMTPAYAPCVLPLPDAQLEALGDALTSAAWREVPYEGTEPDGERHILYLDTDGVRTTLTVCADGTAFYTADGVGHRYVTAADTPIYEAVQEAISYPGAPEDLLLCDMDAPDLEAAVWEAVPLETETTEETLPATE